MIKNVTILLTIITILLTNVSIYAEEIDTENVSVESYDDNNSMKCGRIEEPIYVILPNGEWVEESEYIKNIEPTEEVDTTDKTETVEQTVVCDENNIEQSVSEPISDTCIEICDTETPKAFFNNSINTNNSPKTGEGNVYAIIKLIVIFVLIIFLIFVRLSVDKNQ